MLPSAPTMSRNLLPGSVVAIAALTVVQSTAAPIDVPHAKVELIAAQASVRPGESLLVALRLNHEQGWHTYWKNPGDSGMPTRIGWVLPPGFSAGPILWPIPERIPVGPLTNFGYHGETFLLTEIATPKSLGSARSVRIEGKAEWLICKEVCIPGGTTITLDLPIGDGAPDPAWSGVLARARSAVPQPIQGWRVSAAPTSDHVEIALVPGGAKPPLIEKLAFFPDDAGILDNPAPQTLLRRDDGSYRLQLTADPGFKGAITTLTGLLVAEPGLDSQGRIPAALISVPWPGGAPRVAAKPPESALDAAQIIAAAKSDGAQPGLGLAILFALLGGIVLNLMPCVFPVVSIKVLGFVEEAHGSARSLRAHGLAFAAGIVVCFWVVAGALLALRASGRALGWGFQLQSPPIVAALAALFFVLGLNLSGVFEWGFRLQSAAGQVRDRSGLRGAFLAGLLATVVAAPCTAPFMGAALGFALTQSPGPAMLVFTALAVGMAAPYVALSFQPGLARRLPKPGRWMETLKQLLAFPLYLTAVWLTWVLGEQLGVGATARLLAALVLVAAALWTWTRFGASATAPGRRILVATAAIVLLATAAAFGWPTGEPRAATGSAAGPWTSYSDQALAAERARGQAVFVDFTAAWCVTCQVNKRLVLESEAVKRAFAARPITRMRADWTNQDARITAALRRLGRSGVPVYAVYPARAGEGPELLPELLTNDIVLRALERAVPGSS